jgi:hypothetical protein
VTFKCCLGNYDIRIILPLSDRSTLESEKLDHLKRICEFSPFVRIRILRVGRQMNSGLRQQFYDGNSENFIQLHQ